MKELGKFSKFLVVGGANTLLTYAIYAFLLWTGVQYLVALTLEYIVGISVGFIANRLWTFGSKGPVLAALGRYVATYIGMYALNFVLLAVLVECLRIDALVAQIAAQGVATVASYSLQRLWVFKGREAQRSRSL